MHSAFCMGMVPRDEVADGFGGGRRRSSLLSRQSHSPTRCLSLHCKAWVYCSWIGDPLALSDVKDHWTPLITLCLGRSILHRLIFSNPRHDLQSRYNRWGLTLRDDALQNVNWLQHSSVFRLTFPTPLP